jgi:hypothetical protein
VVGNTFLIRSFLTKRSLKLSNYIISSSSHPLLVDSTLLLCLSNHVLLPLSAHCLIWIRASELPPRHCSPIPAMHFLRISRLAEQRTSFCVRAILRTKVFGWLVPKDIHLEDGNSVSYRNVGQPSTFDSTSSQKAEVVHVFHYS